MLFFWDNLQISQKYVHLQCVFHSIRFKVNKGWSKALLLFFLPNTDDIPFLLNHQKGEHTLLLTIPHVFLI